MAVPSQNKWWGLNQEGYLAEQIKYVDQSDYIRPDGGRWSAEVNPGLFMGAKRLTAMHRQTGCLKWPHVCPTLRWKAQVSQLRVKRLEKMMSESSQSSQWAWHHSLVCEIVVWSSELNVFAGTITELQMGWTKVGFDYEIILFDLSVALHQSVSISQIFLLFHSYCDHNLQNELCVLSNVVQIKSIGSSHRPASPQVSPLWLLTSMQV